MRGDLAQFLLVATCWPVEHHHELAAIATGHQRLAETVDDRQRMGFGTGDRDHHGDERSTHRLASRAVMAMRRRKNLLTLTCSSARKPSRNTFTATNHATAPAATAPMS